MISLKIIRKYKAFALIFFFAFFNTALFSIDSSKLATGGRMDLKSVGFFRDELIKLDGEWEFYWNKLLTPKDFSENVVPPDAYVKMPSGWEKMEIDGKRLPFFGKSTIRLTLSLPESKDIQYALFITQVNSAAKIWIDDEFICEIGKVGDSKAETKPIHKMQVVPFRSKNSDLTILIQVSNYSLQSGGFWKSVEIGNIKTVDKRIASLCAKSFTIFGVLILFAFYHIFLFILNFKNKSALFFSLICLSYAVRIIVSDEKVLTIISPSFNFDLLIRLEYLSLYLSILFFPMFFRAIFPKESNFYTLLISSVFLTALSILTLTLPLERINFTLNFFYIVGIFTFISLLISLISAVRCKRTGALLFLSVSILFTLTAINDSLSAMLVINTPFFLPLGFIIFMAGQSFVIATIFNEALVTLQKLKKEIENKNIELEKKVVERTKNLQETNEKLSVALSEIKTLSGFLPICSECKKIRNENGNWEQIENYVKKNSTADFTHSMCPDCMKKFYPGV